MKTPALTLLLALAATTPAPTAPTTTPPAPAKPAAAPKPAPIRLVTTKLGENLWRISGVEAGAVLVLDGPDGLLIVDTQDSLTTRQLDAAIAKISRRPVRYVVNTHYHLDHTRGNDRFRARGAAVIAHANVPAQALKDTTVTDLGWDRQPLPAAALPTVTFRDSLRLRVNGEDIVLWNPPAAHTDGDAMLWFPGRNLIHTGDIVEVGAPPFVDWWAGGTLDGMIAAVDRVLAMSDERTTIVPGHGDVVNREWVLRYRALLAATTERARAAIARGQSLKEFGDSNPLPEYAEMLGGERRARRLAIQSYYGLNGLKP